jgi:toxin ParE1/3/4
MEVHFAPDTEAQLKQFAASKGKAASQVVEETVARMLERQAQFIEGVNRGIAAAEPRRPCRPRRSGKAHRPALSPVTRIRWTSQAADQLEAIVNHICKDNPSAARTLAQTILGRIAILQKFPGLGRPGERSGTRELVSPPYVIAYGSRRISPRSCTFGMARRTGVDLQK